MISKMQMYDKTKEQGPTRLEMASKAFDIAQGVGDVGSKGLDAYFKRAGQAELEAQNKDFNKKRP